VERSNHSEAKKSIAPFIPGALDDAGLPKTDFRVFCHIRRREDIGNGCYASSETIARTCKIHRDSVYASVKRLLARNFISQERRQGQTTIYRTRRIADWLPVGKQGARETDGRPSDAYGGRSEIRDDHPSEKEGHKGNPSEGNPYKAVNLTALSLATENEMMERIRRHIPHDQMQSETGGMIRTLLRQNPSKFRRVIDDNEAALREGKPIRNLAGYFIDTWKRFQ